MSLSRRTLLQSGIVTVALPANSKAQAKTPIRIGVISDMNGPYADFAGMGVVIAARLAANEFSDGVLGRPIEILSGDHQTIPTSLRPSREIGSTRKALMRSWKAATQARRLPYRSSLKKNIASS